MQLKILALTDLAIALLPVVAVGFIMLRWLGDRAQTVYAALRMLLQLLLIGYVLETLFRQDMPLLTVAVILLMVGVSASIAMRPLTTAGRANTIAAVAGIGIGGSLNLALMIFAVIRPDQLFQPRLVIPLAGMVYANCMNAVSLAAERFQSELRTQDTIGARNLAFNAAMLPQVNALLAVGLVSLPGMMTGQILSGVSPLIAVRYQIMVMSMVFGSAGISSAIYLWWLVRKSPQSG